MDPNTRALMMGAAGAGGAAETLYVEDVFSTWLYNGTGNDQTIVNGIDLAGKGGLVWTKVRSTVNLDGGHYFADSARGIGTNTYKRLASNSTAAEANTSNQGLSAFNADGYSIVGGDQYVNDGGRLYASWTFRKAAKFFDVVTYTGDGTNRTIAHNLGSVPGCIIVKRTDASEGWHVYHRSIGATQYLLLSGTDVAATLAAMWDSTAPTASVFSLGTNPGVNANGATYVAYLFAHETGPDSLIQCGSYTGNGSTTGPTISLGWEPQWLMIKRTNSTGNWNILDNMRGIETGGSAPNDSSTAANLTAAESYDSFVALTATGFSLETTLSDYNSSGGTYAYIAIRRGPMKTPTDATKVFQPKVYTGTNVDNRLVTTDIVTDMAWIRQRNDAVLTGMVVGDRIRGQNYLLTGGTAGDVNDNDSLDREIVTSVEYGNAWSSMTGFWVGNDLTAKLNANTTSNNHVVEAFRRAPGFLDIVPYTGTGSATTFAHGLGVTPELIIVKRRTGTQGWPVYHNARGATKYLLLESNAAEVTSTARWNDTAPTSTVFTVGTSLDVNASGITYVAYLFASCSGVSKVGSYAGTNGIINVDCGFTSGARFVMIKCATSTGAWYVWDTARGINASTVTEPFLRLNGSTAEVTSQSYIDTLSSGFQIPVGAQTAEINDGQSTTNYIYLAIA